MSTSSCPLRKWTPISPSELQTSLVAMGVPSSAQMREMYQGCFANIRFLDTQGKADFYNFLVKIGLAPPLPIRHVSEIRAGIPAQLYSPSNELYRVPPWLPLCTERSGHCSIFCLWAISDSERDGFAGRSGTIFRLRRSFAFIEPSYTSCHQFSSSVRFRSCVV